MRREPIQQLRVRRFLTLDSEVFRRTRQPAPEQLLPRPVHRHPRRQRILGRDQPSRQRQPIRWPIRRQRTQRLGRPWRYLGAEIFVVTTQPDMRGMPVRILSQRHDEAELRIFLRQSSELFVRRLEMQLFIALLAQRPFCIPHKEVRQRFAIPL